MDYKGPYESRLSFNEIQRLRFLNERFDAQKLIFSITSHSNVCIRIKVSVLVLAII